MKIRGKSVDFLICCSHDVVFTAVPIGGVPRPLDGGALDVQYFAPDALPPRFFWWQRQRLVDALARNTAVSTLQEVPWPFGAVSADEVRAANFKLNDVMAQFMQSGTTHCEVGDEL